MDDTDDSCTVHTTRLSKEISAGPGLSLCLANIRQSVFENLVPG